MILVPIRLRRRVDESAYEALETYLSKNGYEPAGAAWECYLDEPDVPEPRTKVYQPARRLSRRPT